MSTKTKRRRGAGRKPLASFALPTAMTGNAMAMQFFKATQRKLRRHTMKKKGGAA